MGLGIAHRLNGNRRVAADLDGADLDASGFVSGHDLLQCEMLNGK
jgi:hypothetical protein